MDYNDGPEVREVFRSRTAFAWVALVLASILLLAAAATAPPPEPAAEPVHAGGDTMERLVVEVTRALLRDDAAAARKGLDQIEGACRRLMPEEADRFSDEFVATDRAFHITLDRAREYTGAGAVEPAFEEFFYVQGSCRTCHEHARKLGLLPARGPLWKDFREGDEQPRQNGAVEGARE